MPTYNGHRNWNHWNVSLWMANDENMYRRAVWCLAGRTLKHATRCFMEIYRDSTTPDGARYSYAAVYAALRNLRD